MTFAVHRLEKWRHIHRFSKKGWLFRGQSDESWPLRTAFERCCDRENVSPAKRPSIERELIREFRRTYHLYGTHIPKRKSRLEWLSVMQHHGTPTRMLDFTYSVYVAAFFALETATTDSAIWAIHLPWAMQQSIKQLREKGKDTSAVHSLQERWHSEKREQVVADLIFESPGVLLACPLNPFHLNRRLRTQKGVFLVPGSVSKSFEKNLKALPEYDYEGNCIKITIPNAMRKKALRQLFEMNIDRTSLFPGLDGFAASLATHPPVYNPIDLTNGSK